MFVFDTFFVKSNEVGRLVHSRNNAKFVLREENDI